MPHDRFFIDGPLSAVATLEGEEFHHLTRVMRKKEGERLELINGKHLLATGTISHLDKKSALITLKKVEEKQPLLPPLILIQAQPKLPNLELILQKGTELGVSHFYITQSALSETKEPTPTQLHRLHQILKSATKQCGRLDLPSLTWGFPQLNVPTFFGDLSPKAPPLSSVATLPAALLIGPEKGFTPEEINHHKTYAQGVRLAPYTLRAETAALAAISQIVHCTIH